MQPATDKATIERLGFDPDPSKGYHRFKPDLGESDQKFLRETLGKNPDTYTCKTATQYSNNLNRAYDIWSFCNKKKNNVSVAMKKLAETSLYFRLRNMLAYVHTRYRNNYGYTEDQISEFKDNVVISQFNLFSKYPGKYIGYSWRHYLKNVWKIELHYYYNTIRIKSEHVKAASELFLDDDELDLDNAIACQYDAEYYDDMIFTEQVVDQCQDLVNQFRFGGDPISEMLYKRIAVRYISTGEFRLIHQLKWIPKKTRFRMIALAMLIQDKMAREFNHD